MTQRSPSARTAIHLTRTGPSCELARIAEIGRVWRPKSSGQLNLKRLARDHGDEGHSVASDAGVFRPRGVDEKCSRVAELDAYRLNT